MSSVTRQTQNVEQMLVYCWSSVEDDGPTVNQHWLDIFCLLGKGRLSRRRPGESGACRTRGDTGQILNLLRVIKTQYQGLQHNISCFPASTLSLSDLTYNKQKTASVQTISISRKPPQWKRFQFRCDISRLSHMQWFSL